MLAGSAAFVLLITCANVAHLQLARFDARRQELGTRLALGAPPSSLLALLLIESLPLSLLGGLAGLTLCGLLFRPLLAVLPDGIQRFHEVEDYGSSKTWQRLSRDLVSALGGLPGVRAAAAAAYLPMQDGPPMSFLISGRDPEAPDGSGMGQFLGVTPGYFEVLGVALRRGRTFDDADRESDTRAVIINEELAGNLWPDEDPVGQTVVLGPPVLTALGDPRPRQIIGVVADVREDGFGYPPPPMIYVPFAQLPDAFAARFTMIRPLGLLLETEVPPQTLARQVQEEVWSFDGDLPIFSFTSLEDLLARNLGPQAALMRLVGLFAALAALLSAIGIYGVLAYQVGQRTREIGIRMATGGNRLQIMAWIFRRGMSAVLAGLVIGLAGAALLTRSIAGYVVIDPLDALSFLVVPVMLALLAFAAISLPAHRAARVQPSQALRSE